MNDDDILTACTLAAEESIADGEYGWNGWFTAHHVKKFLQDPPLHLAPHLQRLASQRRLVEGSWAQSVSLGTSASVFRLPE